MNKVSNRDLSGADYKCQEFSAPIGTPESSLLKAICEWWEENTKSYWDIHPIDIWHIAFEVNEEAIYAMVYWSVALASEAPSSSKGAYALPSYHLD